jgi:hypothetical protein
LPAGNDERVVHEQLVEDGRLAQVALAGSGALVAPSWSGSTQRNRVASQRLQLQLSGLDVAPERDPGQRFACLPEDVVRQRPITIPRLLRQWLALTGKIVELTPLLRFTDLLLDGAFPPRQFFRRTARSRRWQIFWANQLASAWIDSASTSISRLSCGSVLISGGAMTMVLFKRRGSTPFWAQRATIRPVKATALS